jgi:tetratricopeptide (TPR) repeat protein
MRATFSIQLALTMAALALGPEPASAQTKGPASASSAESVAKADALFREGNSDVKQQKWTEAEAKFASAFSLNPSFDLAANLGHTQYRLGKYREAATHLSFALRSWPISDKNRERREMVVKRLAEVRAQVATVTIHVSVPGAVVLVDGKEIGRAPLDVEVFVDPGARGGVRAV